MERRAMSRRTAARCLASLVATVAAGCKSRMNGRVPVTGKVTLDGQPLFGVVVRFYPSPDTYGNGGYGFADAAGRFTATTLQARPGLYPGVYKVTLGPPEEGLDQAGPAASPVKVPGMYGDLETTPLEVTIAEPRADLDLRVNSDKK